MFAGTAQRAACIRRGVLEGYGAPSEWKFYWQIM